VAISTEASIKKMILPGAIAILAPLIMGFLLGPEALGGFLAGATVSGVLMGMFQNNAGGAWDNAKKSFEKGVVINGETYYKKSEPHKASVTGDTVGDPFKDTSGPSMNILIKLMSIVSLVIAPTLATLHHTRSAEVADNKTFEMKISETSHGDDASVNLAINGNSIENELKGLVEELKKENLSENGKLCVELKDGNLLINGKQQPDEMLKKLQPFLKDKKKLDFSINVDEK
jgi:K(+)-stimulated pyrophosphate-energized sodium pump